MTKGYFFFERWGRWGGRKQATYKCNAFYEERCESQVTLHNEPSQNALNFGYTRTSGIFRKRAHKMRSNESKDTLDDNRGKWIRKKEHNRQTHREHDKYNPPRQRHRAPRMPRLTTVHLIPLHLPATELLVQPPTIWTVAHFDVREPFADDGDDGSVYSNAYAYKMQTYSSFLPWNGVGYIPTRLTTNHVWAAYAAARTRAHTHGIVTSPRGPRLGA